MLQNFLDSVPQFRQVLNALGRSFDMPVFAAGVSGAERAMLISGIEKRGKKPVLVITPDEASATKLSEDISSLCEPGAVALYPIRDLVSEWRKVLPRNMNKRDLRCSEEFLKEAAELL